MEIMNLEMEEDGIWRGHVKIDGLVHKFICTTEFIQDRLMYNAMIDTIKTGPFTDEEVADWHKYDKMIGDPAFWEGARSRVRIDNEYREVYWPESSTFHD